MSVLPYPKLHDKAPFVVLSDWVSWWIRLWDSHPPEDTDGLSRSLALLDRMGRLPTKILMIVSVR